MFFHLIFQKTFTVIIGTDKVQSVILAQSKNTFEGEQLFLTEHVRFRLQMHRVGIV